MKNKKTNLLIIHTDQQSRWTIGAYGGTAVPTPNIDRLADEGALFTNFFTNSAVCTPSRGCFVTGRYPHSHGAWSNNIPLNNEEVTFAKVLKHNGYDTGYAGKWHLDGTPRPGWVHPQRCFGFEDNRWMFNRGHWKQIISRGSDNPRVFTSGEAVGNSETYTTDWLKDRTIDFLKQKRDKPFCFMLSIPDPHAPFPVRPPYDTMFKPENMPIPANFADANIAEWAKENQDTYYNLNDTERESKLRKQRALYCGMVKLIDDCVGEIVAELENQRIADNTIIVFTSDHGDYLGQHGLFGKNIMYEDAYRIPMIIRCPEKIRKGITVDSIFSTVDFQPTILKLMGCTPSGREEGCDKSAILAGETDSPTSEAHLYRDKDIVGIVTADYWFGIHKTGEKILFDRKNDPWELNNLADDNTLQPIIKELSERIREHHKQLSTPASEWIDDVL